MADAGEPEHVVKFCDGPLDGVRFESGDFVEKVVFQYTDGRTYRYECDCVERDADRPAVSEHRMVLTTADVGEYDAELRADERRGPPPRKPKGKGK